MNADSTSAIAEPWRTADATNAEGPRRGSGCTVNKLIVRDDLIRRMIPFPVRQPAPILHGNRKCCWLSVSSHGAPNLRATELHPGKVTTAKSRDPCLRGKRIIKYARVLLALQGHLSNANHFGQVEVKVVMAAECQGFFHSHFKRFGTVDRAHEA
jgi:hypothetical protein